MKVYGGLVVGELPRLERPLGHISAVQRKRQPVATSANDLWAIDLVSDALFDKRCLRMLAVINAFTREALAIVVAQGIKGEQVVKVMTRISTIRGVPRAIRVGNGPEFISGAGSLGL